MRLSVREDDPGYDLRLAPEAKVLIDGVEIKNCFTADEELGCAWCYATDADGRLLLNDDGTEFVEVQRVGKVKIVVAADVARSA